MTSVAHLSTGFLLKAGFPRAPLLWVLLAAEAPDLIWVALNSLHAAGEAPLETARIEAPFRFVGDLKVLEQPFSHSLLANLVLAVFLGMLAYLATRRVEARIGAVGIPVFLAVVGHWVLDALVHDADLPLWPTAGSARAGALLHLDAAGAPGLGLSSTAPLASWALQTAVVFVGVLAFLIRFPSTARRRRGFIALWVVLAAAAAPVFVRDLAPGLFSSTAAVVLGTLVEIALYTTVLYQVVARLTHPGIRPVFGPLSEELANLLRGYQTAAAALAFVLAGAYLVQAGLSASTAPVTGAAATIALAGAYLIVGSGLAGTSLSAWWPALFLPLLVGPLVRASCGPGPLGMLTMGLELLLLLAAFFSLTKLRTHKLML